MFYDLKPDALKGCMSKNLHINELFFYSYFNQEIQNNNILQLIYYLNVINIILNFFIKLSFTPINHLYTHMY